MLPYIAYMDPMGNASGFDVECSDDDAYAQSTAVNLQQTTHNTTVSKVHK